MLTTQCLVVLGYAIIDTSAITVPDKNLELTDSRGGGGDPKSIEQNVAARKTCT